MEHKIFSLGAAVAVGTLTKPVPKKRTFSTQDLWRLLRRIAHH
ncbi:hypothetical protein [Paraburkholderia bannensis]|nr:hypothetical protein [Paraburkholderia bannensis]